MKVSSLRALEKHLEESTSLLYLIASPHEVDRQEISIKLVSAIHKRYPDASLLRFIGSADFAGALKELQTDDLFATSRILFLDEVGTLKEEESGYLKRWISNPSSKVFFILGIESMRGLTSFLPLIKKEGILLDLLQEKPWERQSRLMEDLQAMAREAHIAVDHQVLDFLLKQVGTDWTTLKSEMEKLLCYAADKKQIHVEDAQSLLSSGIFPEGWTLAEQLVYHPYALITAPPLEATAFLSLLGQMRYYLRMGRQIALGEEKGYMPLKPYQVQKFKDQVQKKGLQFFEKGLLVLNETEALAKSSSLPSALLLSRFALHLHLAI